MNRAVSGAQELPEGCGGVVAQDRALAASEHRSHPAAVVSGSAVTHCVDAAVEAMQTPTTSAF